MTNNTPTVISTLFKRSIYCELAGKTRAEKHRQQSVLSGSVIVPLVGDGDFAQRAVLGSAKNPRCYNLAECGSTHIYPHRW